MSAAGPPGLVTRRGQAGLNCEGCTAPGAFQFQRIKGGGTGFEDVYA